ncbi:MAG: hypothetical protein WDO74_15000 [Pseudomonadota bacterium]
MPISGIDLVTCANTVGFGRALVETLPTPRVGSNADFFGKFVQAADITAPYDLRMRIIRQEAIGSRDRPLARTESHPRTTAPRRALTAMAVLVAAVLTIFACASSDKGDDTNSAGSVGHSAGNTASDPPASGWNCSEVSGGCVCSTAKTFGGPSQCAAAYSCCYRYSLAFGQQTIWNCECSNAGPSVCMTAAGKVGGEVRASCPL